MFVQIITKGLVAAELHLSQLSVVPQIEVGGAHKADVDAIVAVIAAAVKTWQKQNTGKQRPTRALSRCMLTDVDAEADRGPRRVFSFA